MGAGKTTIGKYLAEHLKLRFADTDSEIEARTGADIPWIFDVEGEEGFRDREQQVVAEMYCVPRTAVPWPVGAMLSIFMPPLMSRCGERVATGDGLFCKKVILRKSCELSWQNVTRCTGK
jgi:hypothetical protein